MPDATIIDAGKAFIGSDASVLGALCVLLMAALVWVVRQWLIEMKAHDETRDARLDDARQYAADSEAMRNAMQASATAMQANTHTMQTMIEIARDRRRA